MFRSFRYIAQLEERLAEVEDFLGHESLVKPTMANNSSREEQTTSAISLDRAALITSRNGSYPWMRMNKSQMPSHENRNSLGFNLGVALQAHDRGGPELSTLGDHVTDRLAGSLWLQPPLALQSGSLPARQQLPARAVALELVQETFRDYNKFLPLFDEEDFLREFQLKYTTFNPGDASWWACLNVVLSIAHRLRALRLLDPTHENILACGYTQNALGVVSELNVSDRSLSAV